MFNGGKKDKKKFSIRLSSGKEKSFGSAEEMWSWFSKEKNISSRKTKRKKKRKNINKDDRDK